MTRESKMVYYSYLQVSPDLLLGRRIGLHPLLLAHLRGGDGSDSVLGQGDGGVEQLTLTRGRGVVDSSLFYTHLVHMSVSISTYHVLRATLTKGKTIRI